MIDTDARGILVNEMTPPQLLQVAELVHALAHGLPVSGGSPLALDPIIGIETVTARRLYDSMVNRNEYSANKIEDIKTVRVWSSCGLKRWTGSTNTSTTKDSATTVAASAAASGG